VAVRGLPPRREYRGKKSDAVLVIDSRSIPSGALVVVSIGVVEAGCLDALAPMTSAHDEIGVEAEQILVATSVEPWVYVILYWGTEDEFNRRWRPRGLFSTRTPSLTVGLLPRRAAWEATVSEWFMIGTRGSSPTVREGVFIQQR